MSLDGRPDLVLRIVLLFALMQAIGRTFRGIADFARLQVEKGS